MATKNILQERIAKLQEDVVIENDRFQACDIMLEQKTKQHEKQKEEIDTLKATLDKTHTRYFKETSRLNTKIQFLTANLEDVRTALYTINKIA